MIPKQHDPCKVKKEVRTNEQAVQRVVLPANRAPEKVSKKASSKNPSRKMMVSRVTAGIHRYQQRDDV